MSVTVEHDGFSVDSNATAADALAAIGGTAAETPPVEAPPPPEPVPEPSETPDGVEPPAEPEKAATPPTGRPWKLLHETEKTLKQTQREARELRDRLDALERGTPATPAASVPSAATVPPAMAPVRPKLSDFNDWDSYDAAVGQYEEKREAFLERKFQAELETRQQKEQQTRQATQFEQELGARLNSIDTLGRSAYPDWQNVIDAAVQAGPWDPRVTTAIATHPKAEHLAYALAKDPEEARRLGAIQHPVSFGVEVGQFIARVTAASTTGPAAPAKRTTAHAPIKPVGSSVGSAEPNLDDLEFGPEYMRLWNAREAKRLKRR